MFAYSRIFSNSSPPTSKDCLYFKTLEVCYPRNIDEKAFFLSLPAQTITDSKVNPPTPVASAVPSGGTHSPKRPCHPLLTYAKPRCRQPGFKLKRVAVRSVTQIITRWGFAIIVTYNKVGWVSPTAWNHWHKKFVSCSFQGFLHFRQLFFLQRTKFPLASSTVTTTNSACRFGCLQPRREGECTREQVTASTTWHLLLLPSRLK